MKKFVVFSILIAVAAITVGVIRRQTDSPETAVAAAEITTTTAAATSSTTAVTQAVKVAAKTEATVRRATAPTTTGAVATTSTTRPATSTTTSPAAVILGTPVSSTTTIRFKPACALTVENPTVAPEGDQVVRLTSNMPNVSAAIKIGSKGSQWTKTDSNGSASWQVQAPTTSGVVPVTTTFAFITGQVIGSVCSSSFDVTS